ncbi:MAG: LPS assembly lipoprotein LptE [Elusimicrobiota bacterium]
MRRLPLVLAVAAALAALAAMSACIDDPGATHPSGLPSTGRKLIVRPISNKSQQFGLEDALSNAVRDEFLRDGRYQLVAESAADDVVSITITRYLLAPLAYDVSLAPISYKLRIFVDVQMFDRASGKELWSEKNLEGSLTYANSILAGGQTEAQAQTTIWSVLAPMIVSRVAQGFEAAPSTAPAAAAPAPPAPELPATR